MLETVRTALTKRLANVQKNIAILEDAMLDSVSGGVGSMELDTGEARQKVVLRNPEAITRALTTLYAQEESLLRRLGGSGLVSIRRRRKS